MSDLLELADRLEKAEGPSHELDLAIAQACYTHGFGGVNYDPALWVERHGGHSGSLDAAVTLRPEGWSRSINDTDDMGAAIVELYNPHMASYKTGDLCVDGSVFSRAKTWPLALCAAALRARAASGEKMGLSAIDEKGVG